MKAISGAEFLLSNSKIIGYNISGDPEETAVILPEKWTRTIFKFIQTPNFKTGFSERRNQGPAKTEVVYCIPFSPQPAKEAFRFTGKRKY